MTRRGRRRVIVGAAIATAIALSILDHAGFFGYRSDDRVRFDGAACRSVRVIDGDTLEIDLPDGEIPTTRIRLRGIDAPEIAHDAQSGDAHYGRDAAAYLAERVMDRGLTIRLDPNRSTRDKYGRLLAYLHVGDEIASLNEKMIVSGRAYADLRFDHVFKTHFVQREAKAERAKVGLWKDVTPEQYPKWRSRLFANAAK